MSDSGIGASVRRKEDDRFLKGRGIYVGDLQFPNMKDVSFVRSPVAHARLVSGQIPDHLRTSIFAAADLTSVKAPRAVSSLPGFQASEQPPLLKDKIRYVGELIAFCVADTRAEAEDLASQVVVEYEEFPAVVDMLEAQRPGAPFVHDTAKQNTYIRAGFDGDIESAAKDAAAIVKREALYTGTVRATGRDANSGSNAKALLRYEVRAATPASSEVDISVKFLLTGALAQFSRSGLIKDVADHLTTMFASKVADVLSGKVLAPQTGSVLDVGSIAKAAFMSRLVAIFKHLFKRKRSYSYQQGAGNELDSRTRRTCQQAKRRSERIQSAGDIQTVNRTQEIVASQG